jgi:putative ABC transport system ATP-binding protein
MDAALETIDLWKTFQPSGVHAVRGAALRVADGEVAAIFGRSGSGKSTFLQMVGAMLAPSKGEIRVAGRPLSSLNEEARAELRRHHIGFVFQQFNLLPNLTALENVETVLRLRRERNTLRRAEEWLVRVGLSHRLRSLPTEMSGGEQQRVAIARALVHRPRLVLADEPTGCLDSENGLAVMNVLTELAKESRCAVVMVTHDPRLQSYVHKAYSMSDGKLSTLS